jgi:hypothetical protein
MPTNLEITYSDSSFTNTYQKKFSVTRILCLKKMALNLPPLMKTAQKALKIIEAVKEATVKEFGCFLKPSELFHAIAMKGNNQADTHSQGESHNFILPDLTRILKNTEQSTLGGKRLLNFATVTTKEYPNFP